MGKRIDYLKEWEVNELFQQMYNDNSKHRNRNIAIYELMKYGGLRVSEISNMKLDDYDHVKKTIFCSRLKGSNNNMLQIVDPNVYEAIDRYLMERRSYDTELPYMFLSQKRKKLSRQQMDRIIKKYCQYTDIPLEKRHCHILKHTRAVQLAEHGFDIDDIQFWLGHKNIQNTLIYLQYTTNIRRSLFNQLAKLEGGNHKNEQ